MEYKSTGSVCIKTAQSLRRRSVIVLMRNCDYSAVEPKYTLMALEGRVRTILVHEIDGYDSSENGIRKYRRRLHKAGERKVFSF